MLEIIKRDIESFSWRTKIITSLLSNLKTRITPTFIEKTIVSRLNALLLFQVLFLLFDLDLNSIPLYNRRQNANWQCQNDGEDFLPWFQASRSVKYELAIHYLVVGTIRIIKELLPQCLFKVSLLRFIHFYFLNKIIMISPNFTIFNNN